MNITKSQKGFILFLALWLLLFVFCSVLSGIASSPKEQPARTTPPIQSSSAQPSGSTTPAVTTEPSSSTDPVVSSPYDKLTYSAENANYYIFIDAGHGWYDNGASVKINENGEYDENGEYIYEKDITLQMTKKLKQALEKMGYRVGETRPGDAESDCPVPLVNGIFYAKDRPAYINAQAPDYLVSIHCNTFTSATASGTRIFYSDKLPSNLRFADSLALAITQQMGEEASLHLNPELYILLYSSMPTVLIETGFMTNPDDLRELRDSDWQDRFVCAIAQGIDADIRSSAEN